MVVTITTWFLLVAIEMSTQSDASIVRRCLSYKNTVEISNGPKLSILTTSTNEQCIKECLANSDCYGSSFTTFTKIYNCYLFGKNYILRHQLVPNQQYLSTVCKGLKEFNKDCVKIADGRGYGGGPPIHTLNSTICSETCKSQQNCLASTWDVEYNARLEGLNCFIFNEGSYYLESSWNYAKFDTFICRDDNPCTSTNYPCNENADCVDLIAAASTTPNICTCKKGYYGDGKHCTRCNFQQGTAVSENTLPAGTTPSIENCIDICLDKWQSKNSSINGVSYSMQDNKCFCEVGMKGHNSSENGTTSCILQDLPIDGNWGQWGNWSNSSNCFPTCGGIGLSGRVRTRLCDNPAPKRNGKSCIGKSKEEKFETCMTSPCAAVPDHQRFNYIPSIEQLAWQQAYDKCRELPNRVLAKFTTKDDFKILQSKVDQKQYWIGMLDPLNNVDFLYWEGKRDKPIRGYIGEWEANEPSSSSDQCIIIGNRNKKLADQNCMTTAYYICRTDLRVDGGWSQWSKWVSNTSCPNTCGVNSTHILLRRRNCTSPEPKHTGRFCVGGDVESKTGICPFHPCKGKSTSRKTTVIGVSVSLCIVVILGICLCVACCRRRQNRQLTRYISTKSNRSGLRVFFSSKRKKHSDGWEMETKGIVCIKKIGDGAFGKVYSATLDKKMFVSSFYAQKNGTSPNAKRKLYAVKYLKDGANEMEHNDFNEEINLMKKIGYHKNVLSMIGCSTRDYPKCIILEYMAGGDLQYYLRDRRTKVSNSMISLNTDKSKDDFQSTPHGDAYENELTPHDLISFALQIASGMEYLGSLNLVHRDLAARNILVGSMKDVKISDFGLTRFVDGNLMYTGHKNRKLPIRWMSIEAIFDLEFTTYSDVWAYGVLLFEIFTIGGTPYPGIQNKELPNLLKQGYRLEKPENCTEFLYDIMTKCWKKESKKRPTFEHLRETFTNILEDEEEYVSFDINEQSDYYIMWNIEESIDSDSSNCSRDQDDEKTPNWQPLRDLTSVEDGVVNYENTGQI